MLQNNVRRLKSRNLRKLLRNSSDMRPVWAEDQSSAVFDFKNNRVYAKGKRWPLKNFPGFVASGGDNGTVIRNGVIVSATAPRVGDDGLVVEEERTNEVAYSNDFTQANWTKLGTATAPSANELSLPASSDGVVQEGSSSVTAGQTWTGSVELRGAAGEKTTIRVARFGGGTFESTAVEVTLTSDWTRYEVSHTYANNQTASRLDIGRFSGAADATSVEARYAQLEQGSFASSYIPTAGSTVTRTADSIALTDLAALGLTSSVLSAGYTVVVEGIIPDVSPANYLFAINGADTFSDIFGAYYDDDVGGVDRVFGLLESGNVAESPTLTVDPSLSPGATIKIAYTISSSRRQLCVNGTLSSEDTSNTLPVGPQELVIGARTGALNHLNQSIRRLSIIPGVGTAAQLRSLSLR